METTGTTTSILPPVPLYPRALIATLAANQTRTKAPEARGHRRFIGKHERSSSLCLSLTERRPSTNGRTLRPAKRENRDAIMARLEDTIVLLETERATLGLPNARRPL
jgi:hypothetical protein